MSHPYQHLPPEAFWRTAISDNHVNDISDLWSPKFVIRPGHKIVTAGSCFAQHFAAALRANKYRWLDAEPGPRNASKLATDAVHRKYNYGIFSFRTGNIYTPNMLLQWVKWAYGLDEVYERYWEDDGRYYDPFRPAIEPNGFESVEELENARAYTLQAIRSAFEQANFFVFTLGLTEAWQNKSTKEEYASCPGVHAGQYDESQHEFVNHSFEETRDTLREALSIISRLSGKTATRFLLTVSPVPLTATASGEHVLTATMRSKSILRAAAAAVADGENKIDYFPSYEIISSHPFKGFFFEPNLRGVNAMGVEYVMKTFFSSQEKKISGLKALANQKASLKLTEDQSVPTADAGMQADNLVCEEIALDAFAPR